MILGTGIDIASVDRFRSSGHTLLSRILSPLDRAYAEKFADPAPHIAGFWAAKEALVKALDDTSITFADISILHSGKGKPFFSYEPPRGKLHLSISHEKEYAAAVVIWEE